MKRLFALLVLTVACSSSTPQASAPQSASVPEEVPAVPEGTVSECLGADDEVVDCVTDADCCEGFECGRDPDVSSVRRVCVFSG